MAELTALGISHRPSSIAPCSMHTYNFKVLESIYNVFMNSAVPVMAVTINYKF